MDTITLGELAGRFELELVGDGATVIEGVCTLAPGKPGRLSFLGNPRLSHLLSASKAGAVIVSRRHAEALPGSGLIARDPGLAYARIARLFDPDREFEAGIAPSAVVDDSADIGAGCHIGASSVIGPGARIGPGCYVGPGSVVGRDAVIGAGSRLVAQVHIGNRVSIGERCVIQPGAIVGSRGFGNAMGPQGWEEIPQLGSVRVEDDVEIGAHTCIDRGALDDTVIKRGARLDNLIQIAHNCVIGEHTAIAACVGIAGSTRIGARCMIGGQAGFSGHLVIGDDVVVLGSAMVTKSLPEKGVYGSGIPVESAREWRRMVARVRRLQATESRLAALEKRLGIDAADQDLNGEEKPDGSE